MTYAKFRLTCGYKASGRLDLTGTGITAPGVTDEQWVGATWATGNAAGQVDTVAAVLRTLAAGAYEEIDLYGGLVLDSGGATVGTLIDVTGVAALFQTVMAVQVQLVSGAGVRLGGAATDPHPLWWGGTAPTHDIGTGGPPFSAGDAAGRAVTSTARRLRVLNLDGTNPATYRVGLGGIKQ